MVTIEPSAFYSVLGSVITAIVAGLVYVMRERTRSKAYTEKSQADGYIIQEKTRENAIDTLADIARQSTLIQASMVEAVRDMTRTSGENSAHLSGMVKMQDDHTKAIRAVILSVDEIAESVPKLKTDLEGTISQQFAPIVVALTGIGVQLTNLVQTVQAKDGEINARLSTLIDDFRQTENRLMKALEPIVLKTIGELTHEPSSSDNHKAV